MVLYELIEMLEAIDPATKVPYGFGNPHSHRGTYANLAFEPVRDTTVGEMLKCARGALGRTFTAYKGGEYTMGTHTDVWLATWGEVGEDIGPVLLRYMLGLPQKVEES